MNNDLDPLSTILIIYTIPGILLLLGGIIVTVLGYGKEKKSLKLAGVVIAGIGIQVLIVVAVLALYFNFILSLA